MAILFLPHWKWKTDENRPIMKETIVLEAPIFHPMAIGGRSQTENPLEEGYETSSFETKPIACCNAANMGRTCPF